METKNKLAQIVSTITKETVDDSNASEKQQDSNISPNKPKSIIKLVSEINNELLILKGLIADTGYTGIEDNFRIRQKLNNLIYQIRRTQDLLIKIKSKNSNTKL